MKVAAGRHRHRRRARRHRGGRPLLPAAPLRGAARPSRSSSPGAGTTTRRSPRSWAVPGAWPSRRWPGSTATSSTAPSTASPRWCGPSAPGPAASRPATCARYALGVALGAIVLVARPHRPEQRPVMLAAEASPELPAPHRHGRAAGHRRGRHRARVAASRRVGPARGHALLGRHRRPHRGDPRRLRDGRRRLPDGREDHLDPATSTSPGTSASTASRSSSSC